MLTNSEAQTIAQTTLTQLGGSRARAMIAAKHVIFDKDGSVQFKFSGSKAFNFVKITLDASDTYTIRFCKLVSYDVRAEHTISGVYADQLVNIFQVNTGLYLSL